MSKQDGLGPNVQRLLDGEHVVDANADERREADRLTAMLDQYASQLRTPGTEVDRAVMAAVRAREAREPSRSFWTWLIQPQTLSVRPVLLAASLALALAVGFWGAARLSDRGDFPAVTAAAGEILVRFEFVAPNAESVTLAGSFNEWSPEGIALALDPGSGVWTGTVPLPPGEHEYLFIVDGTTWLPDPRAHAQVDDGFGQTNSVIVVGPRGVVRS